MEINFGDNSENLRFFIRSVQINEYVSSETQSDLPNRRLSRVMWVCIQILLVFTVLGRN